MTHDRVGRRAPTARDQHPGLRRAAVVSVLVAALLGGGSVAWAAWSSAGSGTATAKAGTALAPTTDITGLVVTGLLYPGGTGEATVRVTNPNPYPVKVSSIAQNGTVSSSCTTPGIAFATQNPTTGNSIAANGGSLVMTFPTAVSMASTAGDNCQGVSFTIPVLVTVQSG